MRRILGTLVLLACVNCSSGSTSTSSPNGSSTDPSITGGNGDNAGDPFSAGAGSNPDKALGSSDAAPTGSTPPPTAQGMHFGTYISLGDSISDGGGKGPFFNNLLLKNDDSIYPDWKGKDLSTKYPGIKYVHKAKVGAITDAYTGESSGSTPKLSTQIKSLEHDYPGDILITLTIGGNDMMGHVVQIIMGGDEAIKSQLSDHLKVALSELTTPGRLGSGKVLIVEGNIYDASDGEGNWGSVGHCGPNMDAPGGPSQNAEAFASWNGLIASAIATSGGGKVIPFDMHSLFKGHGFNGSDNWFIKDCLHPTRPGHGALRAGIWKAISGENQ